MYRLNTKVVESLQEDLKVFNDNAFFLVGVQLGNETLVLSHFKILGSNWNEDKKDLDDILPR